MKEKIVCTWDEEVIEPGESYIEYEGKPFRNTDNFGHWLFANNEVTKDEMHEYISCDSKLLDEFCRWLGKENDYLCKDKHVSTDFDDLMNWEGEE